MLRPSRSNAAGLPGTDSRSPSSGTGEEPSGGGFSAARSGEVAVERVNG